jgi:O-antigen ligase
MLELTDVSVPTEIPLRKTWILIAALPIAAILVLLTQNPFGWVTIVLGGIIALVAVWKAALLARRDPTWLAFFLMLLQLLDGLFVLSDRMRPLLTYGLALVFCLPAIPALSSAWKARKSGFRLYLLFCIWCLISVSYSISPEFSMARLLRSLVLFASITLCSLAARRTGESKPLLRALTLAAVAVTLMTTAAVLLPHSMTWSVRDVNVPTAVQGSGAEMPDVDDGIERFHGLFGGPNEVGELGGLTVGLILTYFSFANRRERFILGMIAFLAVALAALADSRSDMVGQAIGSILYLCWRYRLKGIATIAALVLIGAVLSKAMGNDLTPYIWRGDVSTLTGRTDIWRFAVKQLAAKPLLGYGWAVAGTIFSSKYFPVWWGPFDQGPRSSVHSGYLAFMLGVGIPATIFWLFIILRPWVSLFRQSEDPWCLKRAFFFLVIPMLVINLDESMVTDCAGAAGFLFMMVWALAEQYRLASIRRASVAAQRALDDLPPAVAALQLS